MIFAAAALGAPLAAVFAALAAPSTAGYAGRGTLVVQTSLGGPGIRVTIGGDIALEARGQELRVDLLDLAIPGGDQLLSAALSTQLIPPGGFTVVYDRSASTYTVWSNAKHAYFTGGGTAAAKAPPAGGADAALGTSSDLLGAFAFARGLKDDSAFNVSLSLAGHETVNGHPATGVDYQYSRTTTAGDATDVRGRLELADDLDDIPLQVTASLKTKSLPDSAVKLDLTTLAKSSPSESDFTVPPGYTRASNAGEVLGRTLF
jgi:hypothetical protein